MIYTKAIPHPSNSHSLQVTYRAVEYDEDIYRASICVEIIEVETDYSESGEVIGTDWLDIDYINSKI